MTFFRRLLLLFACGGLQTLGAVTAVPQEDMGRLFFTPMERARLDAMREEKARAPQNAPEKPVA